MKIVVCVKYVPDATGDRRFTDELTVDRDVDGLLSELDEYAIEQALQVAEAADDDVEVVALTMGPDDAADAIKKALQMGASSGVHVCDDDLAGSDSLATSAVLAAAIGKLAPDLVICGMASTDASMGVVAAMLGERLGWPAATLAHELSVSNRVVTIVRDAETSTQRIEAALPAIVSVTDQSGEARYPGLKNIMAAKKKPVQQWDLADLGLEAASVGAAAAATAVDDATERPAKRAGRIVTDEDGSGARALVEFLSEGRYR